jgi:aminoglycoside phosphotransferase (APT) family kinase protein
LKLEDQIDVEGLTRYMVEQGVAEPGVGPELELLAGGRSGNLTLLVRLPDRDLVLRRPPLGDYDARAYDVSREYRFISALAPSPVPVAQPVALCEADGPIGAPFYLMERVEGRIITGAADAEDVIAAGELEPLCGMVVDELAHLHAVEPAEVGLDAVGRPEGFVERQVRRWTGQWEERRQRDIVELDEISRRLRAAVDAGSIPLDPARPTIVHGDFNLNNLILSPDDYVVRAVLDWEQATVGHPLVDLGVLMTQNGPWQDRILNVDDGIGSLPDYPSPDWVAQRYASISGVDVSTIAFFHLLAVFKILVITEDVRQRFEAGLAIGEQYEGLGNFAEQIAAEALEMAAASDVVGLK